MKVFIYLIVLLFVSQSNSLHAQIYADFTVSHGGSPLGSFRVRLDYDKAPRTCANFIGLATGKRAWLNTKTGKIMTGVKYYDGLKFHRLIHNFVIQGGDPLGTGAGGPGYVFQDEFHPDLRHTGRYKLSMANSGTNSNGSQFFITLAATAHLDYKHSVFGEVISGKSIIDNFTDSKTFPTGANGVPSSPIVMDSVVISGPSLNNFNIDDPAYILPIVRGVKSKVEYDSAANSYTLSWDRKAQQEYFPAFSYDLSSWIFTSKPYLLSLNDADNYEYKIPNITANRFFSRITAVDYSSLPAAPSDLVANNKVVTLSMGNSETLTLTFNGSGGGSWTHSAGTTGSSSPPNPGGGWTDSGGTTGVLSAVSWSDSAPDQGIYSGAAMQARYIPIGQLKASFDTPVGSEKWESLALSLSFHTSTSGWSDGSVTVKNAAGTGTEQITKRVPFTYKP